MYILDALPTLDVGYSLFLIMSAGIGLALIMFGHSSKVRIFNLFGSGVFIFLATQFVEFLPMLIVCIGIILYEVYYAFFGGD